MQTEKGRAARSAARIGTGTARTPVRGRPSWQWLIEQQTSVRKRDVRVRPATRLHFPVDQLVTAPREERRVESLDDVSDDSVRRRVRQRAGADRIPDSLARCHDNSTARRRPSRAGAAMGRAAGAPARAVEQTPSFRRRLEQCRAGAAGCFSGPCCAVPPHTTRAGMMNARGRAPRALRSGVGPTRSSSMAPPRPWRTASAMLTTSARISSTRPSARRGRSRPGSVEVQRRWLSVRVGPRIYCANDHRRADFRDD